MTKSKQEIIDEIKAHIQKEGSGYRSWYVGISEDARDRLFNGHGVPKENAWWIFREVSSASVACEGEEYFVNTLGTDGAPGGGSDKSNQVYAYKKTSVTNP